MADHRIETKILLRYATYSQWMSSDLILLPGEAAVAYFPRTSTLTNTDDVPDLTPPAIGIKIGDGHSYFDELPWVQAIAADVYSWAKEENKPTYAATEITGLTEFINSVGGGGGSGGNSAASYRIIYDSTNNKYILQYYDETSQDWVSTTSEINLAQILNRINTIERWANGARSNLGNIEVPIVEYIYEEVLNYINALDYPDQIEPHQFITSVVQTDGVIAVTRSTISMSDISGVLSTEQGGTGVSRVEDDELLVGSMDGTLQVRRFVTHIESDDRNVFVTAGAVIDYVLSQTAGLTGAMHFIGEATIPITGDQPHMDPQISGYNFRNVQAGDVILANGAQEFVWTGDSWRLLGDEGSYAIKGSITNADIAEEANIAQSKIDGLSDSFNAKVDKVDGKGLSTNDYTNDDKNKLTDIEPDAQVNVIEHVFFNDEEVNPTIVNGYAKSIDLHFNGMSQEQGEKLDGIEAGAEVNTIEAITLDGQPVPVTNRVAAITTDHTAYENKIEAIYVNGTEQTPDQQKRVNITIDESALSFEVINGAVIPNLIGGGNESITVEDKKLQLARIAKTGNVSDLLQTENTYIILQCGSSTEVI